MNGASQRLARLDPVLRNLLLLFVPWTLLIVLVGGLLYDRLLDARLAPLLQVQEATLSESLNVLNRRLASVRDNLLFLSRQPLLLKALDSSSTVDSQVLAQLFEQFSSSARVYDQIRWIDERGQEQVRVEYSESQVKVVPPESLQNKSDRYYFIETMNLAKGEFYLSRFDLNQEEGKLQVPDKPTLRAATPIYDSQNKRRGILIINYLGQDILGRVKQVGVRLNNPVSLVDHEGYWMLAPDSEQTWGFMRGQPEATLAARYPQAWRAMQQSPSGQFTNEAGIWSYVSFDPREQPEFAPPSDNAGDQVWRLIALLPEAALHGHRAAVFGQVFGFGILMVGLGLMVTLKLAFSERERDTARQALEGSSVRLALSNQELQQSLEQLRRTQNALIQAEKLSSLGTMVAGVAHELNTPIGAASMAASTLEKSTQEIAGSFSQGLQRAALERYLQRSAEGLAMIITNLTRMALLTRAFKQLAGDRASTERRVFDLGGLIEEVLLVLSARLKNSGNQVQVMLAEKLVLDSYPGALGQILQNLIDNALIHAFETGQQGKVTVRAYMDTQANVCVMEVQDNGRGMSDEVLGKIFDPFFTTRRGQGGTGLGLHITHQLAVDVLGAQLSVRSVVGEGTWFTLRLPLQRA